MNILLISIIIIMIVLLIMIFKTRISRLKVDGQMVITEDEDGKKRFTLELNTHPDEMAEMEYIVFKVTNQENPDFV